MSSNTSTSPRSCAYLAFVVLNDWANVVHILSMCDAFATRGFDTELFVYPANSTPPSAEAVQHGYGLVHTPRLHWVRPSANRWAARLRLVIESARAGRRHTHIYARNALPVLGALLGGAPHVFLELHQPLTALHERVAFAFVRRARRLQIVCISKRLAEMVAAEHGIPESSLIVEHTGTAFPAQHDYDAHSADGRRLVAMYVGTFAPGRGLETMFALAERHPRIDFVLVGGHEYPGELPPNVTLHPPVAHAEVQALLARADVLLMPYTRGTMLPDGHGGTAEYCSPLKMFEYLSAGRSIIASELPSISEILVDGSNCLLVAPESVEEWSAALARLEADAELRTRLAHGAATTAEHHSIVDRVGRILGEAGSAT